MYNNCKGELSKLITHFLYKGLFNIKSEDIPTYFFVENKIYKTETILSDNMKFAISEIRDKGQKRPFFFFYMI